MTAPGLLRMKEPLAGIKVNGPGIQVRNPSELTDGIAPLLHDFTLFSFLGFLRIKTNSIFLKYTPLVYVCQGLRLSIFCAPYFSP
jgi:hypothetical protein